MELCQSCGMPLADEVKGLNWDHTPSEEFCLHCYKYGEFTQDISMEQQINRLVQMVREKFNMSEEQARTIAEETLPKLKRWQ